MTRLVYCPGVCSECGCSAEAPCEGGCFWVDDDLCSSCASPAVEGGPLVGGGELFDPDDPDEVYGLDDDILE
jgi:hypothetical protein